MEQSLMDKLTILADSAKYDVACTSSGASRAARAGTLGSCYAPGCCHAFTADGRCVSLLKVLMSNCCAFDCSYCVNRKSNDLPRATFSPRELAELTIEFYRRNYIEGLFLSSAVLGTPDYTTERMLSVLRLLRNEYHFGGYIHAKTIPGTSPELIRQMGFLADRLSVNVELPSEQSLHLLAPDKGRHSIFRPMKGSSSGGTTTYPITIRIDETDGLRPGMNANAEIVVAEASNALVVPNAAVIRGGYVLVTKKSPSAANAVEDMDAPEGYVYVKVETGVSDDSYTQIKSGLQEDDTVAYDTSSVSDDYYSDSIW